MITPKVSNSCYLQVNPTWHNCLYSRFSSSMVWCSWATNHCMIWPWLIPTRSQWINRNWVFSCEANSRISFKVGIDILMYIHARNSIIFLWQIDKYNIESTGPSDLPEAVRHQPDDNSEWPISTRPWHSAHAIVRLSTLSKYLQAANKPLYHLYVG